MKTSPFFPRGRRRYIPVIVNALLAIGLTVVSFRYVQPKDCYRFCDASEGIPCPSGTCTFGEQKAGWPLPAFVDAPGGGSPTGGWGLLEPEDLPLGVPMILDVLFYSILLWLALYIIGLAQGQTLDPKLIVVTLPMNALLAAFLWMFYFLFGFTAGFEIIGRGHGEQVYMDTPTSTTAAMGFSPIVSIPLEELIENYGDPDYVWFTHESTTEAPTIGIVLYWNSISMFVELPQIANKTYAVHKRTDIEMIIFFDEQDVTRVAGKPLSGEKIPWTGYGNYPP